MISAESRTAELKAPQKMTDHCPAPPARPHGLLPPYTLEADELPLPTRKIRCLFVGGEGCHAARTGSDGRARGSDGRGRARDDGGRKRDEGGSLLGVALSSLHHRRCNKGMSAYATIRKRWPDWIREIPTQAPSTSFLLQETDDRIRYQLKALSM
jgi:hypothetical protein